MQITLNGESKTISDNLTVDQLINELGLQQKRLAIEINKEILPRSFFTTHRFMDGDHIEIVQAIGGG